MRHVSPTTAKSCGRRRTTRPRYQNAVGGYRQCHSRWLIGSPAASAEKIRGWECCCRRGQVIHFCSSCACFSCPRFAFSNRSGSHGCGLGGLIGDAESVALLADVMPNQALSNGYSCRMCLRNASREREISLVMCLSVGWLQRAMTGHSLFMGVDVWLVKRGHTAGRLDMRAK